MKLAITTAMLATACGSSASTPRPTIGNTGGDTVVPDPEICAIVTRLHSMTVQQWREHPAEQKIAWGGAPGDLIVNGIPMAWRVDRATASPRELFDATVRALATCNAVRGWKVEREEGALYLERGDDWLLLVSRGDESPPYVVQIQFRRLRE